MSGSVPTLLNRERRQGRDTPRPPIRAILLQLRGLSILCVARTEVIDTFKITFGVLSVGFTVTAYWVYFWQIVNNENIHPQPTSWLLWGLVTGVAYAMQRIRGAGPGSWTTVITVGACFAICIFAWRKKRGKWSFSRLDGMTLTLGLIDRKST